MAFDVRRFDIYRKIPKDLTQPTLTGAIISVCCCCFILALFLSEFLHFMNVTVMQMGVFFYKFSFYPFASATMLYRCELKHLYCSKQSIKFWVIGSPPTNGTWGNQMRVWKSIAFVTIVSIRNLSKTVLLIGPIHVNLLWSFVLSLRSKVPL